MFKRNQYDYRTKEQKRIDRKLAFERKVDEGFKFVRNNYDVLLIIVPASVAIVKCGTKLITSTINHHTAIVNERFQQRTIYDRSLGRYTELKRPLKNNEALIIERRKASGETLNVILDDMNLLKR